MQNYQRKADINSGSVVFRDRKFLDAPQAKQEFNPSIEAAYMFEYEDAMRIADELNKDLPEDALSKEFAQVACFTNYAKFRDDIDGEGNTVGNIVIDKKGKYRTQCSQYDIAMNNKELFFYWLNEYNF